MADPFIAEIRMWGMTWAPKNFAFCDGGLLAIRQNTSLFSILGVNFGGDGKVTFGLPDLQQRVPVGQGQGPGMTQRYMGEMAGDATVVLTQAQLPPSHTHTVKASPAPGASNTPSPTMAPSRGDSMTPYSTAAATPAGAMNAAAVSTFTGGGQPHNNMMPYVAMNFCIALYGVYPPRP